MLINLIGGIYHHTLRLLIRCVCWERDFCGSLILQLSLFLFWKIFEVDWVGHVRISNGINGASLLGCDLCGFFAIFFMRTAISFLTIYREYVGDWQELMWWSSQIMSMIYYEWNTIICTKFSPSPSAIHTNSLPFVHSLVIFTISSPHS